MTKVRTRFAPSPTGLLHAGGARTALFNYLFARHSDGDFVLRVEDTDRERSAVEFEEAICEDLRWLGLGWDEGPGVGKSKESGKFGSYRQSERLEIYKKEAARLLEEGVVYRCYCTVERLKKLKEEQVKEGEPSRYDGRCRGLDGPPAGIDPGASVLRFAVEEGVVTFDDGVHGPVSVEPSKAGGDFIIIGSDGLPTYNFAAAVDDALMEITHVMRGDDHLANTPRQILLTKALGYEVPHFVHLPLVLAEDGKPLSKRHMGVSVRELREAGHIPTAVVNTMARLGWSPGKDMLTTTELTCLFDGKGLSKSASVFDSSTLRWADRESLSKGGGETVEYVTGRLRERFAGSLGKDEGFFKKVVAAAMKSAADVEETAALAAPIILDGEAPTEEAAAFLNEDGPAEILGVLTEEVAKASSLEGDGASQVLSTLKERGHRGRSLFMPIRAALTGRTVGLEAETILRLLGREKVLERLAKYTKEN